MSLEKQCEHGKRLYLCRECAPALTYPDALATDMTKREAFAMAAMQGILAEQDFAKASSAAEWGVMCADAMIEALNKEQEGV